MEFLEGAQPFYKTAGKGKIYEQEEGIEKERALLRSYYPQTAGYVQGFVEDACDRLDYEGSFIYDECPDKHTIERTCQEICQQMEVYQGMRATEVKPRIPKGEDLGDLVGALFCQEILQRRCRRRRCRKFF